MAYNKGIQFEEEIPDPIEFSDEIYQARLRLIKQDKESWNRPANKNDSDKKEFKK